ncbi:MAG: hypothetical protein GY757_18710 [bacterium]|nr:hypothetical protein [bacterium]
MERLDTLLVFCEGPHDVAFCRLVFKYCFDIEKIDWKFSEYPAPLDQRFKTSMEKHAAQDMSMDMAHKFFLPDRTLYNNEKKQCVLLFNTGGKTKTDNPKEFLKHFLILLKQVKVFPDKAEKIIDKCRYLFLYDRDTQTPSEIFKWCRTAFSHIGNEGFINEDFVISEGNKQAASCMNNTFGAYVFSEPGRCGTLEDILLPMIETGRDKIVYQAEEFIDKSFKWETQHVKPKRKTTEIAKRKKAIITTVGQREKPGSSMSVIVDQGKLISKEIFVNNVNVKKFADFIARLL